MKFRTKRRWGIIRGYMIGWTIAFVYLAIVRGIGTIEESSIQFEFWEAFIVALVFGPIFGSISGFIQIVTEERFYRKVSMARLLAFRLVFASLFLFSLVLISYFMVTQVFGEAKGFMAFVIEPGSAPIYFYILSVDLIMLVVRLVNLMLGENNLMKLLRGKFYTPREEERIFMFLDLQSSTTHAENLGHLKYSKMLQDCFNDLGVVVENEAEIYQYVGDEVILTWKFKNGLRNLNCLNAYFNFKQKLNKRGEHYQKQYGCIPFFKAGLNIGTITVTEVGMYKKEIAYHGDTINTAARIQGKCNDLNQEMLISHKLKELLVTGSYSFDKMGNIPLKGKAKEVSIYGVSAIK